MQARAALEANAMDRAAQRTHMQERLRVAQEAGNGGLAGGWQEALAAKRGHQAEHALQVPMHYQGALQMVQCFLCFFTC